MSKTIEGRISFILMAGSAGVSACAEFPNDTRVAKGDEIRWQDYVGTVTHWSTTGNRKGVHFSLPATSRVNEGDVVTLYLYTSKDEASETNQRVSIVMEDDEEDPEQWAGATIEVSKNPSYPYVVTDKTSGATVHTESLDDAWTVARTFTKGV